MSKMFDSLFSLGKTNTGVGGSVIDVEQPSCTCFKCTNDCVINVDDSDSEDDDDEKNLDVNDGPSWMENLTCTPSPVSSWDSKLDALEWLNSPPAYRNDCAINIVGYSPTDSDSEEDEKDLEKGCGQNLPI